MKTNQTKRIEVIGIETESLINFRSKLIKTFVELSHTVTTISKSIIKRATSFITFKVPDRGSVNPTPLGG